VSDRASATQVATAPAGAQAASLDVAAAYRTIPVLPEHKRFLVSGTPEKLFMDHNMPFGIASAHYNLGAVVDASIDIIGARQKELAWEAAESRRLSTIVGEVRKPLAWTNGEAALISRPETVNKVNWEALGVGPIVKWADDLVPFRFPDGSIDPDGHPYHYAYNLDDIWSLSGPLGIPWHATKWSDFSFSVVYLGFVWDLPNRTVSLQDLKRSKYLTKVREFLTPLNTNTRIEKKLAQSLNGTLSHICFVYPHGRTYLTSISAFVAIFDSKHKPRWGPTSLKHDLTWWESILSTVGTPRSLVPRGTLRDLDIWGDASTSWGIGIHFGDQWDAWQLLPNWRTEGRDIGWAESIAVELIVRMLDAMNLENAAVLIRSDNEGVIGAYTKGRGRNFQVNHAIRRVEAIGLATNVSYVLSYVESKLNKADPISRGILGPRAKQLPFYIQLPVELSPFLVHV